MSPEQQPDGTPENRTAVMMWDMAGTLIPYDPVTGRPQPLPGCDQYLPELARHFRLVVTTGDGSASARGFLAGFEILPHMEQVFGDLSRTVLHILRPQDHVCLAFLPVGGDVGVGVTHARPPA